MTKYKYLIGFLLALVFHACDDMIDRNVINETNNGNIQETGTAEIYVLNEGLFNLNNSSLARYSFGDGTTNLNYFRSINHRGLGDTANDMAIYGDKLYIVINVSSQVEVIDLQTGISLKQIPMLEDNGNARQPRHITFHKNKAYICSYDGTVARIDTTSLAIEAYVKVGRNPDGICVQNDKLYVSNSGGLDWDGAGVDHTVSVISIETFKEIKKIEVGPNPGKIAADEYGNVYVATRGKKIDAGDYNFVQINAATDEVTYVYNEKVMSFAINDQLAYLYNYNYTTQESWIKILDLRTGKTIRENFITDGTKIHTPFGIYVNPFSGNVYITDAYDYQIQGDLLCFNQQGQLQYTLQKIGQNPNTVVFSDRRSQNDGGGSTEDPNALAFANKVLEYHPAPSQYINTSISAYKEGFSATQVLDYATERLKARSMLSLGGFGGSIVVGFPHPIRNITGEYDFKIYGNASYNMYGTATGAPGGSAEPGIVQVAKDVNKNGLPDDEWYELAGSEYGSDAETRGYEITYYRPQPENGNVRWKDNQGNEGAILRNSFHSQSSYYPSWISENEITFRGTRLKNNAVNENGMWVAYCYAWGYADNHPNSTEMSKFKIDWAVDTNGKKVILDEIDFVRIYTAINQDAGQMGEISTEVVTVEDLHFNK